MATLEEEFARTPQRPGASPDQLEAVRQYLQQPPSYNPFMQYSYSAPPQQAYPGMVPGYTPSPYKGTGLQPPQRGDFLDAMLQAQQAQAQQPRQSAPFSAPEAAPQAAPQGAAQQFMGVKLQDRLPGAQMGGKGDKLQAPGGMSQQPRGGVGATSGGVAPTQSHGPVTLRAVWDSLAQANPELMKSQQGRITLGMAAMQFYPLMHQQDQMEMQRMKMEMQQQLNMLKLQQGEAKLGMQEMRLAAYEDKMSRGGTGAADKLQKEYDTVAKQANDLANHLAINKGDKNLQARYDTTMQRLKTLEDKINPPAQGKAYEDWLRANPTQVEASIPDDVKKILSPQEFKELVDRQRNDPANAYARVMWLRQKASGGQSTAEKSYGNY